MTRFCPYCGRNIPDDARLCPYCERTLAIHEGMKQTLPYGQQKKDNTVLIIAIVLIVVIVVPIAIAATVYVYVSGMIGEPSNIMDALNTAPEISVIAKADYGDDSKNATITITAVNSENNVYWYYLSYHLYDSTDGEELTEYTDYTLSTPGYSPIKVGDKLKIIGKNGELEDGNNYQLSIIYDLTNEIVTIASWSQ